MSNPSRNVGCDVYIPSILTGAMYLSNGAQQCDLVEINLSWDGTGWGGSGGSGGSLDAYMNRTCTPAGTDCANGLTFHYRNGACVIDGAAGSAGNACTGILAAAGGSGLSAADCCHGVGSSVWWEIQVWGGIPIPIYAPPYFCLECMCDDASCGAGSVQYASGAVKLSATDVQSSGFATPSGHSRNFVSLLPESQGIGQGYNWQVPQWPYLVPDASGNVSVLGSPSGPLRFEKVGSGYDAFCNAPFDLVLDVATGLYSLTDNQGTVTTFDQPTGMFRSQTSPGDNTIAVTAMAANGYNFTAMQRSETTGGVTTTEQLAYDYITPYADSLLQTVTLSRQASGGSWVKVTRANYTYYGPNDANGGLQDLKTVTTQVWDGSAWNDTGTTCYRYYPEYARASEVS